MMFEHRRTSSVRPSGVDFAEHCCELLGSLGTVSARRMFLGWGLSVDGLTVAVIAWDTLFLKVDAETAPRFQAEGCRIFEYTGKGRVRRMAYYTAPEEALESQEAMRPWAALALALRVALVAQRGKRSRA